MTRPTMASAVAAVALVLGFTPATSAQGRVQPRTPNLEISVGALFVGGFAAGEKNADITANQTGGAPYTLFKSSSRIESAPAFEARVGFRISRLFTVEAGAFTGRPQLSTRLSADLEGAPDITASEDLSVYIIDAAILANLSSKPGARVVPFVRAGAGYVRELHEANALVKTGQAFHAGGGITMWLNRRQTIGARADARVYLISGGIDLDGGTRTQGAGSGAVVFAF